LGDALGVGGGRVLRGRRRAGRILDSALALLPRSGGAQFTVGGAATGGASSGGGGTEGERGEQRERVESCGWRERERRVVGSGRERGSLQGGGRGSPVAGGWRLVGC
jgi:hypothetical protein